MDIQTILLILPLVVGYLLDFWFGDPLWMPHPVKAFGWLIAKGEKGLNRGKGRFLKGMCLSLVLLLGVFFTFDLLVVASFEINQYAAIVVSTVFVYFGLANRCLIEEGKAVFTALETEGLEAGRKRLSYIVGRDTSKLTPQQIRTAVFETLSENLSDGVIAPLFYYALAGVPGMMAYKMINTLDSMIGYKSDRYYFFGKFAARMDDVANFIPARLTALLMVLATFSRRGFRFILTYGHQHASPNSGYPEAALAGLLDLRFGGPNVYHGKWVDKPYIGTNEREIGASEIATVVRINHWVTLLMVILVAVFMWVF